MQPHAPPQELVADQRRLSRDALVSGTALLVYLAAVKILLHLAVSGNYGYFRDELYYIAASRRLAFGYVDFPPFTAVLARLVRIAFGDSLVALHVFPALAGALVVVLTGLIARELGGRRFAQVLAGLGSLVSATFLAQNSIFSMDSFDVLWWVLATFVLVRLIKQGEPRLWLLFGLVAGIGLTTKITIAFFGFALVVGLLLTPSRVYLRSRWLWIGGVIAFAFVLPYIIWNYANGWPTVEFWGNYGGKVAPVSALGFVGQQILTMSPPTLPLWLAGLYYYLRTPGGRPYRALGFAYVILFVLFAITNAKSYFLAPAYPMLFAAGAVLFERAVSRRRWRWVRPAYPAILVLGGLFFLPIGLPILPPDQWSRYYGFLGADAGARQEQHAPAQLPQWLADRFGWDTMVATVADVYRQLPPEEQAAACIFTGNYGEAGAIDLFGPRYGLPRAISGHNNYWIWGPGECTGQVVIALGVPREDLETVFAEVTEMARVQCDYCMPYEDDLPVYVLRRPNMLIAEIWPEAKHFD